MKLNRRFSKYSPPAAKGGLNALRCAGLSAVVFAQVSAVAGNEVFVCTDANGTRTYQNTGASDQCRKLNVNPVLTIPQPQQRGRWAGSPPASEPIPPVPSVTGAAPGQAPRASVAPAASQSTGASSQVPHPVLREPQANREQDRLRILESELRDEERRLQSLQQRQLTAPEARVNDDIARSQASLEALRREIAKVRRP